MARTCREEMAPMCQCPGARTVGGNADGSVTTDARKTYNGFNEFRRSRRAATKSLNETTDEYGAPSRNQRKLTAVLHVRRTPKHMKMLFCLHHEPEGTGFARAEGPAVNSPAREAVRAGNSETRNPRAEGPGTPTVPHLRRSCL